MSRRLLIVLGFALATLLAAYLVLTADPPVPEDPEPGTAAPTHRAAAPPRDASGRLQRAAEAVPETGTAGPAAAVPAGETPAGELEVSGRVVDPGGRPVAAAEVHLFHRPDPASLFEGGGGRRGRRFGDLRERLRPRRAAEAARTGDDGAFRIAGRSFEEAEVLLAVLHPEYAPAEESRRWTVSQGVLRLGEITLDPGVMVEGIVVDEDGRPVVGAEVRPQGGGFGGGRRGFSPGRGALETIQEPVRTDAGGRYRIGRLPSGGLRLTADAARHLEGRSEEMDGEPGEILTGVRIELRRAAGIRGVVRGPDGRPVADAEVTGSMSFEAARDLLRRQRDRGGDPAGRWRSRWQFARARERTHTDGEGRFALTELPPVPVRIEVEHEHYTDSVREPVDPGSESWVEVTLGTPATLRGIVVDATTGAPVERYGIRARRLDDDRGRRGRRGRRGGRDRDDAEDAAREAWLRDRLGPSGRVPGRTPPPSEHPEGAFVLEGLEPGEYVLDIAAPDHVAVAAGPVTVNAGQRLDGQRFLLPRGTALTGTVTGSDGRLVAGARLRLGLPEPPAAGEDRDGRSRWRGFRRFRGELATTRTDAEGRYRFPPQRSGPYRLEVTAEGMLDYERDPLQVPDRNRFTFDVELLAGAHLHGVVTGIEPGTEAFLMLVHEEGHRERVRVAPDGSYEIGGLRPGGWVVQLMEGDRRPRRALASLMGREEGQGPDVTLADGQSRRFDVDADADTTGAVTGMVLRNGAPAEGASVRLQPVQRGEGDGRQRLLGRLLSTRIDADGAFRIEDVPAGDYTLEVARARRGRRGGGGSALHREPVHVAEGATREVSLHLSTGEVVLVPPAAEESPEEGDRRPRIRVALVRLEAPVGDDPRSWRTAPSHRTERLRAGNEETVELAQGAWRWAVLDSEPLRSGVVHVSPGTPQRVELEGP